MKAHLFTEARHVIDVLDAIASPSAQFTLILSDRTAARAFSPAARAESELPVPLGARAAELARRLRPLASLGSPGTGLVGAGEALAPLRGAGLGAVRDLDQCLEHGGLPVEEARRVSDSVKQGGVLVLEEAELEPADRAKLAEHAREYVLQFEGEPVLDSPTVHMPRAPAGDQRARYVPQVVPAEGDAGERTEVKSSNLR